MDSSEFTAKVTEAKAQIAEFAAESNSALKTFSFGVGTVAVTAIAGLGLEIAHTADKLNDLYETSKKLGTSTGDLQTLESAFKGFGVTGDSVVRMMGFIQKSIGDTERGIGLAGDAFKALGLNVKDLATMGGADQIETIAKAIGKLKDNTQQMSIARTIAGRGGMDLLGAARGDLAGEIEKFKSLQIDDETAENAHKFVEQLNFAEAKMESLSFKLIGRLHGWFSTLGDYIDEVASKIADIALKIHTPMSGDPGIGDFAKSFSGGDEDSWWGGVKARLDNLIHPFDIAPKGFNDYDPNKEQSYSSIPFYKAGASVQNISSQKVKSQLDDLGESAETASKKIKDMSEIGSMLVSANKKNTSDALKDLLGDTLTGKDPAMNLKNLTKPFESFEEWSKNQQAMGFTNNTNAGYLTAKAEHDVDQDANLSNYRSFQERFQQVFQDAKNYGLNGHPITGGIGGNQTVADEINDLKISAKGLGNGTGYDTSGIVSAVNDLQKFAKEQKDKDNKVEMWVKLDPGLLADVKSAQGVKITLENSAISKAELAAAASSMGK